MGSPSVYAVMKATIEVRVRASGSQETLEQMHNAAKREAEGILRTALQGRAAVIGPVEFSHAVIKQGAP